MNLRALLCVPFAVGCSGASVEPMEGGIIDDGPSIDGGSDPVVLLQGEGFTMKPGTFEIIDLAACCQTSCSGNNPTSPYGAFYLPEGPMQSAPNPNERMDGTAPSYRLRSDEAILFVGQTPPDAAYFGFTPYLMDRANAQGTRAPIFASLSETLNNRVIGTMGSTASETQSFESKTAIIASTDASTTGAIKYALTHSGIPASAINQIIFDPALSHFGLDANADTFGVLFRLALVKDAAKNDAFLKSPGGNVWRVTPPSQGTSPSPSPVARNKSADSSELALKPAVKRLADAIVAANPLYDAAPLLVDAGTPDPVGCIGQLKFCAGDNRDTTYPSMIPRVLFASDDDFYVVYGVDHQVSGKVTYANASVYAAEHLVGLKSVASDKYPGSAQKFLPTDVDAPKLYAWKIARVCNGEPFCLEIPKGACPTGIDNGAAGWISFRTYLEPSSNTAPDPSTLVRDGILRFTKK